MTFFLLGCEVSVWSHEAKSIDHYMVMYEVIDDIIDVLTRKLRVPITNMADHAIHRRQDASVSKTALCQTQWDSQTWAAIRFVACVWAQYPSQHLMRSDSDFEGGVEVVRTVSPKPPQALRLSRLRRMGCLPYSWCSACSQRYLHSRGNQLGCKCCPIIATKLSSLLAGLYAAATVSLVETTFDLLWENQLLVQQVHHVFRQNVIYWVSTIIIQPCTSLCVLQFNCPE